jgi:hypothetical protein
VARRTTVVLTDDLDGSDTDVRSTRFGYDGLNYAIDLSTTNYEKLSEALAPFIATARKDTAQPSSGKAATIQPGSDQAAFNRRVREWSAAQGKPVAERGRVPQSALDAYLAAGLH